MSRIRAAAAFVELSLNKSAFTKGLKSAERSLANTGAKIRGIGQAALGFGGASLGAITLAVDRASDLGEAVSKTEQVFGASSNQIADFAKTSANAFGISTTAANAYASELGLLLLKTGSSEEAAAKHSVAMVKLAGDIASFNNISVDEALTKLKAGLVGSSEPLRSVGVLLSAAAVEARLTERGFKKVNGSFSEGQKVAARYQLILEQTKETQGDFGRTSNGLANIQRRILSSFENIVASAGGALIPIFEETAAKVLAVTSVIGTFVDENQELIRSVFFVIAGITAGGAALVAIGSALGVASFAVGGIVAGMSALASVVGTATAVVAALGSAVAFIASPIGIAITAVAALGAAIFFLTDVGRVVTDWFKNSFSAVSTAVTDAVGGVTDSLKSGNIELAGKIAFTGLKLVVAEVMDSVLSIFGSSVEGMLKMLANLWKQINQVVARINQVRQAGSNFISEAIGSVLLNEQEQQTLREDNARRTQIAAAGTFDADNIDVDEVASGLNQGFSPDELRAQLAALNVTAKKQFEQQKKNEPVPVEAPTPPVPPELPEIKIPESAIQTGQEDFNKTTSVGTFFGGIAGRLSDGSLAAKTFALQKRSLEFLVEVEAKEAKRAKQELEAIKANKPVNLQVV